MKMIILLILFSTQIFAQAGRQERHDTATEAFQNLNFYYKGRGMSVSPDLVKFYDAAKKIRVFSDQGSPFTQRWGFNVVDNQIKGLFNEPYEGMQVAVLGCVACHSGKAAGQFIVGLGNKNIDVGQIGADATLVMKMWGNLPHKNPKFKELHERALTFTKRLSDPRLANNTQGLVPTSLIRSWFYTIKGLEIPEGFLKGQVKVPHMWGYGEKRKTGSFTDGEGNGDLGGWGIAVELYAGQTPENVREYYDKVHKAEDYLGDFLPPKYPFKVNLKKAEAGRVLYEQSCQKCHGDHIQNPQGFPVYDSPKHIPLRVVKTDSERLDALTDELYALIEQNPLSEYIQSWRRPEHGYVAPKLWGVWSRFPYLHNASIPTIYDLLSKPDTRPKKFSLKNSGDRERFDEEKMGLTHMPKDRSKRRLYDTSLHGQSNQGHYFSSFEKLTHENKFELIEYLKML